MDAIASLSSDHRKILLLFGEHRVADTDRARHMAADTLIRELAKHVAAEESMFYPFAAEVLDEDATHRSRELCATIKRDVAVLDGLHGAKRGDTPSMEQLERDVADHIEQDEQYLMPRLRTAADATDLRRLGSRIEQAEQGSPGRAQASSGGGAGAAPFQSLYDRIRTRVRGLAGGRGGRRTA